MDQPLEGRVALVTGAASGIGAAIVARLQAAGARVAGLDRDNALASDHDIVADLRSTEAVAQGCAAATVALGAPGILVHAAAASVPGGCVDTEPEQWAELYDINVIGAVRLLRACVPGMREQGGGAIALLSSINAGFATPTLAAYAASKAALENLTKTAALELAPENIRVNAIAPASIDTPLLRGSFELADDPAAARAANMRRHPLARLGTPEEVAELALFLVSPAAAWITGATYLIDGGAHVTRR